MASDFARDLGRIATMQSLRGALPSAHTMRVPPHHDPAVARHDSCNTPLVRPQGKECHVRSFVKQIIDNDANRSGDRIGADGVDPVTGSLGGEILRLARMATTIHLAETIRTSRPAPGHQMIAGAMREPTQ